MTTNNLIYFDNNATTPLHPKVKKILIDYMDVVGNCDNVADRNMVDVFNKMKNSKIKISEILGVNYDELIFTAGGSESNGTAITCISRGLSEGFKKKYKQTPDINKKNIIITSPIEHKSILSHCEDMKELGHIVEYVNLNKYHEVDIDDLNSKIIHWKKKKYPILVSIMGANNETGILNDLVAIGDICSQYNDVIFHTDLTQVFGKINIDINKVNCDSFSMSFHKIYGPKSTGLLYVKSGTPYKGNLIYGQQEFHKRGGTYNYANIIASAKAMEIIYQNLDEKIKKMNFLRAGLINGLYKIDPDITIISGRDNFRLPNTIFLIFSRIDTIDFLNYVNKSKDNHCMIYDKFSPCVSIMVGMGSACHHGQPSHVLDFIGYGNKKNQVMRISLGHQNTKKECSKFIEILDHYNKKIKK